MRKRNRENSIKSDCIGGESAGVLIRKTSQTDDQNGPFPLLCMGRYADLVAFDGVAAASVPRDWSWSTF